VLINPSSSFNMIEKLGFGAHESGFMLMFSFIGYLLEDEI
jgi:hypothetical protein